MISPVVAVVVVVRKWGALFDLSIKSIVSQVNIMYIIDVYVYFSSKNYRPYT